ncbi:MAG: hypothetical protein N0E54_10410 [Candidatus Thiodiazotropha taylori]|nr:hypothetical protein [Candidatus Thiodiazotropha endolucinida]MCW4229139.1 hypothetical protein [Candidatus Thiodiazotropha taylori]
MRYLGIKSLIHIIMFTLISISISMTNAQESIKPKFSLDRQAVESRLNNVERLIYQSSGARRVANGSEQAKALQEQATNHFEKAQLYFKSSNMELANDELQQATLIMFQAIRLVGTGEVGESKLKSDYQKKRKSLQALLEALQRVAVEKQSPSPETEKIIQYADVADKLAAEGKIKQAQQQLNIAYDTVKQEVEKLRSGDTLVRTLKFASSEEEYVYELDRNDTHFMLVKLLLEDRNITSKAQAAVDQFLLQARQLRSQAEVDSEGGDYEEGIKKLEQSTSQIVRAIRRAGVYIPG